MHRFWSLYDPIIMIAFIKMKACVLVECKPKQKHLHLRYGYQESANQMGFCMGIKKDPGNGSIGLSSILCWTLFLLMSYTVFLQFAVKGCNPDFQ